MDELTERIRRLYAAIGETLERELSKFPPVIGTKDNRLVFVQNFRGGLTDAQIANVAHTAIHAIAHLKDHLRRWAKQNGREAEEVERVLDSSLALKVVMDLSNNDKHGYPPRDGGRSGLAPQVPRFSRVLRLSTGPEPQSVAGVQLTSTGPPFYGSGSAAVVITGDITASDGSVVGELASFLDDAAAAWEKLLLGWGLPLDKAV